MLHITNITEQKNCLLNDILEQSNFRILRGSFRDEGFVLEQKNTSMTPNKIKSYQSGTFFEF